VVTTGEVGTGKTLLVRCLLELLNRKNVAYAYVFNSILSPMEFLQYIAGDLGLPTAGKNKSELLLDLSSFLIARHQQKLTTVLVVDEAHHLPVEVLEEVRLLTNLETAEEKLLQILLVGQPELDLKMDSVELRQLKQRIALRSQLEPLTLEETQGYIHRRLQLAAAEGHNPDLFLLETISSIYRHSRGIPRLINTVCENALITSFARQAHSIAPDVIEEVAADFRLGVVHRVQSNGGQGRNGQALPAVQPPQDSNEVWQAVKTLLQLHDYLQSARARDEEETPFVVSRGNQKI